LPSSRPLASPEPDDILFHPDEINIQPDPGAYVCTANGCIVETAEMPPGTISVRGPVAPSRGTGGQPSKEQNRLAA
jgi:hypothetical protein